MTDEKLWKKSFKIGHISGLEIRTRPSTLLAAILLWAVLSLIGIKVFKWKPENSAAGGLFAVLIHFLSEAWHQIGHARMAEQTGHPMEGMEFWGPIATSLYPQNEGMLSADVHIQRALGGPIFSFALAALSGVIALAMRPLGGPALMLTYFTFLDNLLVFTVGALNPTKF